MVLKQRPRALNIPESSPHPTPSSPPQGLTQSAQTAPNPPCDEEIIPSKRSEPVPALAHTRRCVCVPAGLLQAHLSHADPVSPAANWREMPKVSAALSRHPHPETLEVPATRKCHRHSERICRGPAQPGVPAWSSRWGTLHCMGGMALEGWHFSP